ncbi:hypothetical protein [Amycolatopsis thermoflava]|uniref:Transmembrane protein n=1 Tax=Amycolatopsis thermoflava TaxID=84480 RepID=A0A3N2H9S9_9PSEU|nr:hypothetical protein [Amycolatopsis thermoflava]ROS45090.1 hypothetical protein EDD35_7548 [Amycolatopsis thermoflava]
MAELAGGVTCLWLGMVLGISFLEAPLKFRAPGVTVPLGLGIGRIVFRALNRAEVVLAVLVAAGVALSDVRWPAYPAGAVAAVVLAVQLAVVRPPLNRRSDRVLAGEDVPRSRAHVVYVVLEAVKVLALVALGGLLLTGG